MRRALDRVWLRQLAALVVFLALWEAAGRAGLLNPLYVPRPSAVAAVLRELFGSGTRCYLMWAATRVLFNDESALKLVAEAVPFVAEIVEPFMILLNAVPRVVLAPLFVIWFGIDLGSKIALAFILVAVLIFFTVYTGIRQVDRRLVERVVTLGGGRGALLREVYLPSLVAWILGQLKVAVGFAFTGAVVGEFVAASRGLGYLLSFAQSTYNAALMLALVLLIVAFVLLIFALAGRLERRLLRWRG